MISLDFCLTMLSSLILNKVGIAVEGILAVGVLILIGIIIIMFVGALLFFVPAVIVAGIVFFLTGNELYAAIAFLAIAVLSLIKRK
jgi:hypothetical protein